MSPVRQSKIKLFFEYVWFAAAIFCIAIVPRPLRAQTIIDLHDFNPSGGDASNFNSGRLGQGRDGNLYLESRNGGTSGQGTVTKLTTTGTPTIVFNFNGTNGSQQTGGMTLGPDGNLYGDSQQGGTSNQGVTFKITPGGTQTVLHNFANTGDGFGPVNALVLGADGNYYGATNSTPETIYKVASSGTLTTIHTLATSEGYQGGQLIQGSDGNLYGGMNLGGASGFGTLFKVTTTGIFTVLHNFVSTDGTDAGSGMAQISSGKFFGTAAAGGTGSSGVIYQVTSSGTYTVLHNLTGTTEGSAPGVLLIATDGNAYGTTTNGGTGNCGTIFKVTPSGTFKVIYTFDGTHGCNPEGYLTEDTNGLIYGITNAGGAHSSGTFFSLNVGLSAYISLQSTSGKVGTKVGILGQGFSSSSVVKFNGVQATTVTLSGTTYLTATVPTGASSGKVTVTTGSITLTSTQVFVVHDSWGSGAAMPTALQGAAAGVIGGKVYVLGGATGTGTVAINQIYNPTTNTWTTGASMPTSRFVAAGAVVDNILYVVGGNLNGSSQTNVVEAYNPTTNTWSTKSPMPASRDSVTAVVKNGIIYVIGGFNNGSGRLNTVESYNPTTDNWTEEMPLLDAKSDPSVGLLGSTIVAAGGLLNSGITGDNEGYNATTNTWSALTADPTPRQAACAASISGLLYSASGTNGTPLNVNEAFNATSSKWTTTLAAVPLAVVEPGSATVNNQLYCFGGSDNGAFGQGTVYNNVQIYQP